MLRQRGEMHPVPSHRQNFIASTAEPLSLIDGKFLLMREIPTQKTARLAGGLS
jgi:hypothetical protein